MNTKMEDMMTLMMDVWGLEKPNLLISVTGGAKNFTMKQKLKEEFRRGLMKVARSTGQFIHTSCRRRELHGDIFSRFLL